MNYLQLIELIWYHARPRERVKPGEPPARFTYITVETAFGKRVLTRKESPGAAGTARGVIPEVPRNGHEG